MTARPTDNLDELRAIEGFPIGEDEDLHALSDPPHYTAYPNPHVAEFIERWGKPYDEQTDDYHREPYVADVSEGKNDPIYNAHSYHTKVPYKAIVPFIEHYTEPGDVVFDGFCGTGMTGVAAQMTGRRAVLVDLSPAATFIAYNYNTPVDADAFGREAQRILREVEAECGWMYATRHTQKDTKGREIEGRINYTVWSDVFVCPYCQGEIVFWEAAVDAQAGKVRERFPCPGCGAEVTKRDLDRATERVWDSALGQEIERARQVPVRINYSVGRHRYEKKPDEDDLALIRKIDENEIPYWYPTTRIDRDIDIWYERDYRQLGVYSVDAFFTKRNLWTIAAQWSKIQHHLSDRLNKVVGFALTGNMANLSKMNRWPRLRGPLAGTLYIPSIYYETNPVATFERRINTIRNVFCQLAFSSEDGAISTQSCSSFNTLPPSSVDYVFTDPPFGSNIIYSDLSIIWESWLRVFTNTGYEAVVHRRKKAGFSLDDYRQMMTDAFRQMYRALKPGRWITVVFHNSRASVWNAIQEALAKAGFLVAQVTVMDKKQGTFKQVTSPGAVKNDLIINAYKPRRSFEERFLQRAGYGLVQEFVAQHLGMLPVAPNLERTAQMLYSKMLAYYVQHGYEITLDAGRFYRLLADHFLERDGYWFVDEEQVQEYERRKVARHTKGAKGAKEAPLAQSVLFISDERSAIAWLYHFLETPRSYSEIYTAFVKALQVPEDEIPEIKALLEENFVQTNGNYKRPELLEKQELEARRQQRLLREFEDILEQARRGQRLEHVRKEAVLAGFAHCYREKRFDDILRVGRRLHKRIVESSTEIYDFMDIAEAKVD